MTYKSITKGLAKIVRQLTLLAEQKQREIEEKNVKANAMFVSAGECAEERGHALRTAKKIEDILN